MPVVRKKFDARFGNRALAKSPVPDIQVHQQLFRAEGRSLHTVEKGGPNTPLKWLWTELEVAPAEFAFPLKVSKQLEPAFILKIHVCRAWLLDVQRPIQLNVKARAVNEWDAVSPWVPTQATSRDGSHDVTLGPKCDADIELDAAIVPWTPEQDPHAWGEVEVIFRLEFKYPCHNAIQLLFDVNIRDWHGSEYVPHHAVLFTLPTVVIRNQVRQREHPDALKTLQLIVPTDPAYKDGDITVKHRLAVQFNMEGVCTVSPRGAKRGPTGMPLPPQLPSTLSSDAQLLGSSSTFFSDSNGNPLAMGCSSSPPAPGRMWEHRGSPPAPDLMRVLSLPRGAPHLDYTQQDYGPRPFHSASASWKVQSPCAARSPSGHRHGSGQMQSVSTRTATMSSCLTHNTQNSVSPPTTGIGWRHSATPDNQPVHGSPWSNETTMKGSYFADGSVHMSDAGPSRTLSTPRPYCIEDFTGSKDGMDGDFMAMEEHVHGGSPAGVPIPARQHPALMDFEGFGQMESGSFMRPASLARAETAMDSVHSGTLVFGVDNLGVDGDNMLDEWGGLCSYPPSILDDFGCQQ